MLNLEMWAMPESSMVNNMGAYKYIKKTLEEQRKKRDSTYKEKLTIWRSDPPIIRIYRPSNLPRARELGYKAKQGYVLVRARIKKGNRRRPKPKGGRKPAHNYIFKSPDMSHQGIVEQRVARKFSNLEVLNSYWVGEDGNFKFFEVILIDPTKKTVETKAKNIKGRAFRGLTSAQRKSRGLRVKGKGSEQVRRRGF